jgi:hypothetical protein
VASSITCVQGGWEPIYNMQARVSDIPALSRVSVSVCLSLTHFLSARGRVRDEGREEGRKGGRERESMPCFRYYSERMHRCTVLFRITKPGRRARVQGACLPCL